MKNTLEYYYNVKIDNIHQKNKKYFFMSNGDYYVFTICDDLINEIYDVYELNIYLINLGIYCHQIIKNKTGDIITFINDKNYVLMRTYSELSENININDLEIYNKYYISYFNKLRRNDWKSLWIQKIDYLEYQLTQIGKDYPKLMESFGYFIGLSENAISLYNEIKHDNNFVLSHRRLKNDATYFDFYNPLNFVLDIKVRDIADYIKNNLYDEKINFDFIIKFCEKQQFSENEWKLFFARMMFPTFYYDIYENIIQNIVDDNELVNLIVIIPKYEEILKLLYKYISNKFVMPEIKWLKNLD